MVLSPGSAAPSFLIAASPAANASANSAGSAVAPGSAAPIARKALPYSGPEAPPTLEISVLPVLVRTAPTEAGSRVSRTAETAVKPRRRFLPWSPSPIAESSSVRWASCCSTAVANPRTQASTSGMSTKLFTGVPFGPTRRGRGS